MACGRTLFRPHSCKLELVMKPSDKAEHIAACVVAQEMKAVAVPYDTDGRQGAVDFILEWPDGRRGALEVTLVTGAVEWQALAKKDNWLWPALTAWEFILTGNRFDYQGTKKAVSRVVELCDLWGLGTPEELPCCVLSSEPLLSAFLPTLRGRLQRTGLASPGVRLTQKPTCEWVNPDLDFRQVVEEWLELPHVASHIEKLKKAVGVSERVLFLYPIRDVLPVQFRTDDFRVPELPLKGFDGVDQVWFFSELWHRILVFRDMEWVWVESPCIA